MAEQRTSPAGRHQARRRVVDGRIVILPPEGYGEAWNGSAR